MPTEKHPFTCQRCDQFEKKEFKISPVTGGWLKVYPADKLMHLHFGHPTTNEQESSAAARWVYKTVVDTWYTEYAHTKFFVAVDFFREDDSEFPSDETKKIYRQILQHPQTNRVICYNTTVGMRLIINILSQIAHVRKMHIVRTEEEMEQEYARWLVGRKDNQHKYAK